MAMTYKDTGQRMDYLLYRGKEPIMVETWIRPGYLHLKAFWESFSKIRKCFAQKEEKASGYRTFGKYRVKETFAGEESLTSLLTQDVKRTVAVRY